MNKEEAIELLNDKVKQWEPYKNRKFMGEIEKQIDKENQAIETVLKEYQEKEKANDRLLVMCADYKINYISKDKVREKMDIMQKRYEENIERWNKSGMNKEHPFYRYVIEDKAQIDVLDELLEEK